MHRDQRLPVRIENTGPQHVEPIIALCEKVYPHSRPWSPDQLLSHQEHFPEGQFAAITPEDGRVVGMQANLIVLWDEYDIDDTWRDFTDHGYFTNHDPEGRTMSGAEVMVDPDVQGRGVGGVIYEARHALVSRLGLRRVRAGARLAGYADHMDEMDPKTYVDRVVRGELRDPTLSFQIKRGYRVLAVVEDYLKRDPASGGWAAVIERERRPGPPVPPGPCRRWPGVPPPVHVRP